MIQLFEIDSANPLPVDSNDRGHDPPLYSAACREKRMAEKILQSMRKEEVTRGFSTKRAKRI